MPLYDVICEDCGQEHEYLLRHGEEPPKCECGGDQKRKVVQSGSGFSLKGKGWFKDGY